MIEKACPECGVVHELIDTMDAYPPIPTHAWPERWSIHNGEGRGLMFCPTLVDRDENEPCGCPIEEWDLEPYPWQEEEWRAWDKRQQEAQG